MEKYSEEELLYLARQGCQYAYDLFYENYYQYISTSVAVMNYQTGIPIDQEDYIQAGMVALLGAIDNYREDKNAMMKTYFSIVIRDALRTKYKKQVLEYYRALNKSISLDQSCSVDGYQYEDVIADQKIDSHPDKKLVLKETIEVYETNIKNKLSDLEVDVFNCHIYGFSQEEVAKLLGIDVKAVYNAKYRLQKKISKLKLD